MSKRVCGVWVMSVGVSGLGNRGHGFRGLGDMGRAWVRNFAGLRANFERILNVCFFAFRSKFCCFLLRGWLPGWRLAAAAQAGRLTAGGRAGWLGGPRGWPLAVGEVLASSALSCLACPPCTALCPAILPCPWGSGVISDQGS